MPTAPHLPERVILHIGTQKTASTMIRRFLKANVEVLADRDIKLVDRDTLHGSEFYGYLEDVTHDRVPADADVPEAIAQSLREMVSGEQGTALVTSENMFRRLPLFDFYQRIGGALTMMQRLLPGVRIEVIFYVRQQKSFTESCYTQLIQMGRGLSFEEYTNGQLPKHLKWSAVCDDIAAAIGKDALHVRAFEMIKELGSDGFLRDFLSLLGLDDTQIARFSFDAALTEGRAANRGFSQVAVDMARFTMPMLTPPQRKKLRRFLQEQYSTEHFDRPSYFTAEEAARLKAVYADDNERLFKEYIPGRTAAELGYV